MPPKKQLFLITPKTEAIEERPLLGLQLEKRNSLKPLELVTLGEGGERDKAEWGRDLDSEEKIREPF